MAEQFISRGLYVEKDRPYLALQEYGKALTVLKPVPEKGEVYIRARRRLATVEQVIERRWEALRSQVKVPRYWPDPRAETPGCTVAGSKVKPPSSLNSTTSETASFSSSVMT